MKRHSFLESLKRLIPDLPRINPAVSGAPLQFASSGGGGGRFDDADDDYYDEIPEGSERSSRPERRDANQATAGRRRTVQSEPDDRYWTDYLRIALPVIGLLLVIAVFWFWAQQLIDDGSDEDITATEPGIAELADEATSEPVLAGTPDSDVEDTADPGDQAAPPTAVVANTGQGDEVVAPTAAPDAAQPPADGSDNQVAEDSTGEDVSNVLAGLTAPEGIAADSTVTVIEDALNLRSEATTTVDNIVTTLGAGDELQVVSGPIEAEGITWWEVVTATGDQGFVSEEFIEPVS